jgi:hypothetical protein
MSRRKLTPAELKAYRDLARAAQRLRHAQRQAEFANAAKSERRAKRSDKSR